MFKNPFKKKEDTYTLDDSTLPSMSDLEKNNSSAPRVKDDPTLGTLSNDDDHTGDNYTSFAPVPSHVPPNTMNDRGGDNSSIHGEIARVKIDSMEAKMSLLDAKLSSIDQKLDIVLRILDEEISDDTRRKLKLDSMKAYLRR